jgi:Na+/phosphate symporter
MLVLKKVPMKIAIERNTWFHIGANSDQQFVYTLRRMLNPIKEHVDNNFNPVPEILIREYEPIRRRINDLMQSAADQIQTDRYENYREILAEGDACKDELSQIRKRHINRMQQSTDNSNLQVDMVYLNLLQESQQLLSNMRHQLRSAKKFMEKY